MTAPSLIVAMTADRVIGRDGGMPWHHPADLRWFKRVTSGHAVIMGRRTYESIGRPLPKRRNIVLTRQAGLTIDGCEVLSDLGAALAAVRDDDEPFVIGGGALYAEALPLAARLYVTFLPDRVAGDTFFPAIDPAIWTEVRRESVDDLVFTVWERSTP